MYELFEQVVQKSGPELVPIVSVFCVFAAGTVIVVALILRSALTHRMDLDAKREMVARGLSADEIERILNAGRGTDT